MISKPEDWLYLLLLQFLTQLIDFDCIIKAMSHRTFLRRFINAHLISSNSHLEEIYKKYFY